MRMNTMQNRARGVTSTKSAASARLNPAPKAAPSIAAITGRSRLSRSRKMAFAACMRERRPSLSSCPAAAMPRRSPPAQNAPLAPVITTARMLLSALTRAIAWTRPSFTVAVSALRSAGLSRMTTAVVPWRSKRTVVKLLLIRPPPTDGHESNGLGVGGHGGTALVDPRKRGPSPFASCRLLRRGGGLLLLLQFAPEDLAGAGFGKAVDEFHDPGRLVDRHALAGPVRDVLLAHLAAIGGLEHDERLHGLAALAVGHRNHAGLVDRGVFVHRAFHLGGPHLVARRVDHALQAVAHEEVAFLIHRREVAGAEEPFTLDLDESFAVGLRISPVAFHHLWRAGDQFAHLALRQFL